MGETLDLSTIFDRDEVKRDNGTTVLIRKQVELSVMQDYELRHIIEEINKLDAKKTKTEADAEKGSALLHQLCALVVVDAPEDLEDWECAHIFGFWLARTSIDRVGGQEGDDGPPPARPRPRSSGRGSSPGSKRSTAANRKRGSTSRRSS
jgi:hypothetical protein